MFDVLCTLLFPQGVKIALSLSLNEVKALRPKCVLFCFFILRLSFAYPSLQVRCTFVVGSFAGSDKRASLRRDEGDGMFEVLHTVVVAVHHLAVYDQPEGFVAGNLHRCSLAVFHQSFHFGAVDVGAFAVVVDEAGEFEERHGFEKVHFQKTVVVFGEGCTHVAAAVEASVAEGGEEHVAVEERFAVYAHAHIVGARGEDALDDARGVGMFAADDGFAAHIVADFAHHGVEAEVADVDAVAFVDFHHVHFVRLALHKAGDVVEGLVGGVVFDIVVTASAGHHGDLGKGVVDEACDHLVEGSVSPAGIEAHRLVDVVVAPAFHKLGRIAGTLGNVYAVVKIGVFRGVGFYFWGDFSSRIVFACTGVDNEYVFHNVCVR